MRRLISVCLFQGLIFVVDSNDRERAQEAQDELSKMVSYRSKMVSNRKKSSCIHVVMSKHT